MSYLPPTYLLSNIMEDAAKHCPRKYCGFAFHFSCLMRIAIVLTSCFSSSYWVSVMACQQNREPFLLITQGRHFAENQIFFSITYSARSKEQAKVKSFQFVTIINHPLCANKGQVALPLSLPRSGAGRAEVNHPYHTTKKWGSATITNNFSWSLPIHSVVNSVRCMVVSRTPLRLLAWSPSPSLINYPHCVLLPPRDKWYKGKVITTTS